MALVLPLGTNVLNNNILNIMYRLLGIRELHYFRQYTQLM